MTWNQWCLSLQRATERYLGWRRTRKAIKKEKQKKKNVFLDWLEAILSAVVIVLLINQFLLQAYQIPSQSMVSTLLIGDRIFVNKLVYGPELLPGIVKLPGFRQPQRGEVIIFENPSYIPIGPVKDVLQRIVYMITLSLVDIDRDEFGNPKHHFLVKRAIGMPGDRLRLNQGNMEILPPGMDKWLPEEELKQQLDLRYQTRRLLQPAEYKAFRAAGITLALNDARLPVPAELKKEAERVRSLADNKYVDQWRAQTLFSLHPFSLRLQGLYQELENGWYIPSDRLFPMGDNRDDSHDARYFGAVHLKKVLGKALFRYWPFSRFGGVH